MAEQEIVRVVKIDAGNSPQTVKGLRDEIKGLRDELLNVEKGSKEYEAITEKIVKDQKQLNDVMNAGSKAVKGESVELKELKVALQNLEPGTQAYNQAFTRAATITHNLAEQQEMLKYSSRDLGTQLGNVKGIATNMVAGFSAINAAMGLFGKENEDVQKAMLKTQQLMAMVQGLQGLEGIEKRLKGLTNALTINTKATKSATAAQKGLNAAMKANPIGLLIAALAALIVYWKEIWGWLTKLVGGTERMNQLMDEAKARIMGVANAIAQYLIAPVKAAIQYFKTLGNVMKDVFTGNWSKIKDDVKNGVEGVKDTVKDGFSFMKNYEEGYTKQSTRNAKKRYDEQQRLLAEQTKKNKEQYDKDLDNFIKDEEAKKGADWKYTEEGKKAYEAFYKNKMELYAKDTEEFRQAQRDMWRYQREYQDRINKGKGGTGGKGGKSADELAAEAAQKRLEAYEKVQDYLDTIEWNTQKLHKNELQMIDDLANYYGEIVSKSEDADEIEQITQKFLKEVAALRKITSEEVSKLYVEEMYDAVAAIEKAGEIAVNNLESQFDLKKLMDELIVPDDILDHLEEVFEKEKETIESALDVVVKQINALKDLGLEGTDTYEKLVDKQTELLTRQKRLEIEHIKNVSDAVKQGYEERIEANERYYAELQKKTELENKKEFQEGKGLPQQREQIAADRMFEVETARLEELKAAYAEMMSDLSLSYDEREKAEIQFVQTMNDLEDLRLEHEIENEDRRRALIKQQIENYQSLASSLSSILGSISDAWEDSIRAQVDAGKMSEAEGKRQFENMKILKYVETVINTLSGAISAFMSAQSLGWPMGTIVGSAQAAAVTAAGIAQAIKIKNMSFNGSSSTSVATAPAVTANPTGDFRPNYTQQLTGQNEIDNLRNAVRGGMSDANMQVSVVEINTVQKRVAVRENEASF